MAKRSGLALRKSRHRGQYQTGPGHNAIPPATAGGLSSVTAWWTAIFREFDGITINTYVDHPEGWGRQARLEHPAA